MKPDLPYVVECNAFRFFEPIAAFNVMSVALSYMRDCQASNPNFTYRVITRKQEA